jgi:hypothetical protein
VGKQQDIPVPVISFVKLLGLVRSLWNTLALGSDLLSNKQIQSLSVRFWSCALSQSTKPRTLPRSCPRKVRQPAKQWPKKIHNEFHQGNILFNIISSVPWHHERH